MEHDRQITITCGSSRWSKTWQAQTLLVSELYAKLQTPAVSEETQKAYLSMKKAQQDALKDVGGFVGGTLSGPRRKASAVKSRELVTLDLDNIPAGGTQTVLQRISGLGCGYCVYSTRKHNPGAPRLRVLLPLNRAVPPDEYEAIARKSAEMIGLDLADPSTFEASRLMYWPSRSKDGEYVYHWEDKPFLSADGVLALYEDWRDISTWPQVPGAAKVPQRLAAKQQDPESKEGLVGAFCRVYDIPAAMDAFLPGVYDSAGEDRYTYTGGSTTGGAVLYDGGKYLYSHHATDPCSGRLVNAFDLVRLHKFSGQDDDADPKTPTAKLPSYQAMLRFAGADERVSGLLMDERWAKAQAAFGPVDPEVEESDDGSWRRPPMMEIDGQGKPVKSLRNLHTALVHDPRLKGRLRLNLFSGRIDVTGDLPWSRPIPGSSWNDDDAAQLRIYLEPFFGKVAAKDLLDAVAACASDQAYHPIRDYLTGLEWDGTPRLDTLLIDYLGAEDTPYTRAVTRKAFTAAAARVMKPGCKYDTMLILVGGQGRYKSTLLAKMGGAWFSDSLRTFGDKDAMETIQGTWVNEIAEMQAMAKADINAVKMFLSKTSDYYRAAYGHYTADRPRQCVFFGTTNSRECLTDGTGGRRFWVVDIDRQERRRNVIKDLDAERDQLWAEAMHNWQAGEPLYLTQELEEAARQVQEDHRARHPWEGMILAFLASEVPEDWPKWDLWQRELYQHGGVQYDGVLAVRERVCAVEIWCELLGRRKGDMRQRDSREINAILEQLPGWENTGSARAGKPYGIQRCFSRKSSGFGVTDGV